MNYNDLSKEELIQRLLAAEQTARVAEANLQAERTKKANEYYDHLKAQSGYDCKHFINKFFSFF
jgi:hypothetical protein